MNSGKCKLPRQKSHQLGIVCAIVSVFLFVLLFLLFYRVFSMPRPRLGGRQAGSESAFDPKQTRFLPLTALSRFDGTQHGVIDCIGLQLLTTTRMEPTLMDATSLGVASLEDDIHHSGRRISRAFLTPHVVLGTR